MKLAQEGGALSSQAEPRMPTALYIGTAVAAVWDAVAFNHLFHIHAQIPWVIWWPWAWLFLATVLVGLRNRRGGSRALWACAVLGFGIPAVGFYSDATSLSFFTALGLVAYTSRGRPWWIPLAALATLHALAQWAMGSLWWHASPAIALVTVWVSGIGIIVSTRGSGFRSAEKGSRPPSASAGPIRNGKPRTETARRGTP